MGRKKKKTIDDLKMRLLQSVVSMDQEALKKLDVKELMTLNTFLRTESNEAYVQYILEKLRSEKEHLAAKRVPESKWPEQLRGSDWEARVKNKLGVKPPRKKLPVIIKAIPETPQAVKQERNNNIPVKEEALQVPKVNYGDPFKSDRHGQVLRKDEEDQLGVIPLVNRVRKHW